MRLLPIAAALALAGCAADPTLGESQAAIVGGTTDTGDPSVVLLYAEDGTSAFICTASVIAPRVLLTAAHCVSSQLHSSSTRYYAYLKDDFGQAKAGDLHPAAEVHAQPEWDLNNLEAGHDIGIMILRDPVSLPALPLRRTPLAVSDITKSLRLVGYGATDGSEAGSGLKRQTTTALDDFDDVKITYNDTMHLTCNGDSGGPAFLTRDGVEEIVGTTSYGDTSCTQFGVDTRVDAELAFIDGWIAQAAGPAPPTASSASGKLAAERAWVGDDKADAPLAQKGNYVVGGCAIAAGPRGDAGALALAVLLVFGWGSRRRRAADPR